MKTKDLYTVAWRLGGVSVTWILARAHRHCHRPLRTIFLDYDSGIVGDDVEEGIKKEFGEEVLKDV